MTQQDPINTEENQIPESEVLEELETTLTGDAPTDPGTSQDDQIVQLQNALARSQADYQNLVMRNERDRTEMVHFLSAKILLPLLTQVDNLERAVKLKEWVEGDGFVDGVRSVLAGMQKFLESQGVQAFESIGHEVDPDRHEVMTQWPGAEGIIITEFEKGYTLRDRVLRHAKVVVGSGE